jgi:hypothetical protein
MVIPFPFATCTIRYGAPFKVAPNGEEGAEGQRLQREMDALEAWAERVSRG